MLEVSWTKGQVRASTNTRKFYSNFAQGHGGVGRGGCVQGTTRGDLATVPASKLDCEV